jgi:hypothetical protein
MKLKKLVEKREAELNELMEEHQEAKVECQRRDSRRASRRASRLFQLNNNQKENEDRGGRRGSKRASIINNTAIIKLDSVEEFELDVSAAKANKAQKRASASPCSGENRRQSLMSIRST